MPKTLTIGSQDFDVPIQGDNPDYGETLTDFFEAIADALESVQGPDDILLTTSNIANNQSSAASISGFLFSSTTVKSFIAEYYIERTTVTPAESKIENGVLTGHYNGSTWVFSNGPITGDAGIVFSITAGGQVQYTSDNMTGSSYSGSIKFKAKTINV